MAGHLAIRVLDYGLSVLLAEASMISIHELEPVNTSVPMLGYKDFGVGNVFFGTGTATTGAGVPPGTFNTGIVTGNEATVTSAEPPVPAEPVFAGPLAAAPATSRPMPACTPTVELKAWARFNAAPPPSCL